MKVLVLGDGELGSSIYSLTGWDYISRKKDGMDFLEIKTYFAYLTNYDVILNCVGYTKSYDKNKLNSQQINFRGVIDLTNACSYLGKKLCHISTDFVYANSVHPSSEEDAPSCARNWYAYYKSAADAYIEVTLRNFLIIRTSFKPFPFPYEKALTGLVSNTDYTKRIARIITKLIHYDARGIYNVGSDNPKTIFEMAQESNPDVKPMWDKLDESMPSDTVMDLSKLHKFEKENNIE